MLLALAESTPFDAWPTIIGIGGTLIGLVVGFGLNEMSSLIRANRETRRTFGSALSELLEVRHQLRMLPIAIQSIKKMIPGAMNPVEEFALRKALWSVIPSPQGLQKRYDVAVSAIAGEYPTLAFELRSKDTMAPLLGHLRGALPIEPKDVSVWLEVEDGLIGMAIPKLDESIVELARLHKRSTARYVKKY
jgi:hypothetical protein